MSSISRQMPLGLGAIADWREKLPKVRTRLVISLSGGRSSMYMARQLQLLCGDIFEMVFIFANTGSEDERTLAFVRDCEIAWGMTIIWLESVTNPERGKGVGFRVVDFKTASRNDEPFQAMIAKHGIPNKTRPFCTKELKTRPIFAYIREVLGWGGEGRMGHNYLMALGIRADEPARLRPTLGKIYPLAEYWALDKQDILDWWEDQPFDLNRPLGTGEVLDFPERHGNCVWCWKKSLRKHLLNLGDSRVSHRYEFPQRMEAEHGTTGAGQTGEPHVFFRENRSTLDLIKLADISSPDDRMGSRYTEDDGCSESCEAF